MPKIYIVHFEEDPEAIVRFRMRSRYLWESHVDYAGRAIASIIDDVPALPAIIDCMNANADDIGNVLTTYYGSVYGTTFTDLFKEHIKIALATVRAIKDKTSIETLTAEDRANAEAIADCLAELDPVNWDKETVLSHLENHIAGTTAQAAARMTKEWATELSAYDEGRACMAQIADIIANGIVAVFPEKFVRFEEWMSPGMTAGAVVYANPNADPNKNKNITPTPKK